MASELAFGLACAAHREPVHLAKIAVEKYVLHKVRSGVMERSCEEVIKRLLDVPKLKAPRAA